MITLEWAHFGVFALVVNQVALGCEGFAAAFELTSERLFTRVNAQMSLQVSILSERFPTYSTRKWLLSSVRPLMDLESP